MNKIEQKSVDLASHQEEYENLLPLHYTFVHQGLTFDCDIAKDDTNDKIVVGLTADLGHLPYSAENMVRRMELLEILNPLIARGVVTLDHHCKLTLPVATSLKDGLCASRLMEAITYTLLDLRDVFSRINAVNSRVQATAANA